MRSGSSARCRGAPVPRALRANADAAGEASPDLAEPSALVVDHRLPDFSLAVHYERTVARDGLIEWNAADEQELRSALCRDRHCIAVTAEENHVVLACEPIAKRRL